MLKKTIKYHDFDGNEIEEDFLFNLTKAEVLEMQLNISGGMENFIQKIVNERDIPKLAEMFKTIILKAYGEKSLDGKRFIKSKELSEGFSQTDAYSELYMELLTNEAKAAEFINAIVPSIEENKDAPKMVVAK